MSFWHSLASRSGHKSNLLSNPNMNPCKITTNLTLEPNQIHRILRNPMKPIKSYGIESDEIHRILQLPMKSVDSYGLQRNQQIPTQSYGILWNPMKSIEFCEIQ